ncbi:MAG: response regulator [Candidatus Omnitrophica bacterium]|nr:response regulator [Candidatus Omnitrophota bacterium]
MKILIVDDSKVMRKMIQKGLRQAGYECEVVEAGDGVEALEKLDASITVVFVDVKMPVMDGIELVKEIRKRGNAVPILMITTESSQERIDEAKNAGANGYLIKPFTPAKIKKHLGEVVEN